MKLIDLELKQFIEEIDSKSPTPGGGSVSALSSVLGVSLIRMVGQLTEGKKKFMALESEVQLEFKDVCDAYIMIKNELIDLVDKDTEAFNQIMAAYKMPKDTDLNQADRHQKIQEGTQQAILVPLKVASLSMSALHHLPFMIRYGNKMAISDLGVSILTLCSGIEGACMNVLINISGLDDPFEAKQYRNQVNDMLKKTHKLRDELLNQVYEYLNN